MSAIWREPRGQALVGSGIYSEPERSVRSPPLRTAFHSSSTGRRTAFPSMIVGARLADGLPTALKRLKLPKGCCKTVGYYIKMFVLTYGSGSILSTGLGRPA